MTPTKTSEVLAVTRTLPSLVAPSAVEMVDPATAELWLGHNTHNRPVKRFATAAYARDMAEGNWQYTGEPIKFAADGTLLDGQNRLLAIVESGVTLPMLVVRGLPNQAQAVMDSGARRTSSDALGLAGEINTTTLASVAAMIYTDGSRINKKPTTAEIFKVIEEEPSLRWITSEVLPGLRMTVATPTVIGYCYWRLNKIDATDAAQFFEGFSTLVGLPAGSPILALHRRLGNDNERKSASRKYRQEVCSCIFLAWNAWRKREARSIIKIPRNADGRLANVDPK